MAPGERRLIEIHIRNASPVPWNAWERSGLTLANSWADAAGTVVKKTDDRTMLPALGPNGKAAAGSIHADPACSGRR
jgi:hypothetical protein